MKHQIRILLVYLGSISAFTCGNGLDDVEPSTAETTDERRERQRQKRFDEVVSSAMERRASAPQLTTEATARMATFVTAVGRVQRTRRGSAPEARQRGSLGRRSTSPVVALGVVGMGSRL